MAFGGGGGGAGDDGGDGGGAGGGGAGGGGNANISPETSTGVVLSVVVPSPSRPMPFKPQHFTVPPVSRAHECPEPRAMLVAVVIPETETGVVRWVVVPSPSWPQ